MKTMKGLYRKDLMMIWSAKITLFGIPLLVGTALLINEGSRTGITTFLCLFLAMQGYSTIVTDKMTGWNLFETTLSLTRKGAILEKYLLALTLGLFGTVIGVLFSLLLGLDADQLSISTGMALMMLLSCLATGIPTATKLPRSQFAMSMIISFLVPAAMLYYWCRGISGEVTPAGYVVDMNTACMWWEVLISAGLFLISILVLPSWLARQDQN